MFNTAPTSALPVTPSDSALTDSDPDKSYFAAACSYLAVGLLTHWLDLLVFGPYAGTTPVEVLVVVSAMIWLVNVRLYGWKTTLAMFVCCGLVAAASSGYITEELQRLVTAHPVQPESINFKEVASVINEVAVGEARSGRIQAYVYIATAINEAKTSLFYTPLWSFPTQFASLVRTLKLDMKRAETEPLRYRRLFMIALRPIAQIALATLIVCCWNAAVSRGAVSIGEGIPCALLGVTGDTAWMSLYGFTISSAASLQHGIDALSFATGLIGTLVVYLITTSWKRCIEAGKCAQGVREAVREAQRA